jgi:uncharacterized protein
MTNSFAHIELTTDDVARAKQFYKGLFSWKLKDMAMGPGMTYTMVDTGAPPGGGMMKDPGTGMKPAWTTYVNVKNRAATVAKARELGATVYMEKQEVPGMGEFAVMADPSGAVFAIWQPAMKAPAASKPAARKATAKKKAPAAKKKGAAKKRR